MPAPMRRRLIRRQMAEQATERLHDAQQKQKIDSEVHEKSIQWDTKSTPDGYYRIKVIATNKYACPTDPKSAESISDLFVVANTPPTISVPEKVTGWDALKRIEIKEKITPILGGKFNIDGGPWIALEPENGIFDGTGYLGIAHLPGWRFPSQHRATTKSPSRWSMRRTTCWIAPSPSAYPTNRSPYKPNCICPR